MRLFLFDGNSLICRACFAKGARLSAPNGEPTGGTFFFTKTLLRILREEKPDAVVFAKDERRSKTFRRKLYPSYKKNRKRHSDDLGKQLKRSFQIASVLGLPVIQAKGFEADDVIASMVDIFESKVSETVIVGTDKDLNQLVNDETNVTRLDPYEKEYYDERRVREKMLIAPNQVVEYQAMVGDSVDNVPGIPGVGEKTALDLLGRYRSFTGIEVAARAGELSEALSKKILGATEDGSYKLMRGLVELRRDLNFDLRPDDLVFDGPKIDAARPLFKALGFRRWE